MRNLDSKAGIVEELRFRAWQNRAAASIGRTNKHRTAAAERAARELENAANAIEGFTGFYLCAICGINGPEHGHYDATDSNTHKFECGEAVYS